MVQWVKNLTAVAWVVAAAWIQYLAWELPYAMGVAKKTGEAQKWKNKQKKETVSLQKEKSREFLLSTKQELAFQN